MPPKRKRAAAATGDDGQGIQPANALETTKSRRGGCHALPNNELTRQQENEDPSASAVAEAVMNDRKPAKGRGKKAAQKTNGIKHEAPNDEVALQEETPRKKRQPHKSSVAAKKANDEIKAFKAEQAAKKAAETPIKKEAAEVKGVPADPEAAEAVTEDLEMVKLEAARPPPANSDVLPLPWTGRLGYACLNTYLRNSYPPIFNSRTCRIQSILDHRHPLTDPSQPEHATKNRPNKDLPADIAIGKRYVEELGLANVGDVPKILRWNDKYGIKFFRLSSEMFPFASHEEYGYTLAPFASEALAEAGKVAAELGHRLTTHPGQFTQLGSPRKSVIENAVRDLEVHGEMLTLLKLPEQADRDAVMVLHLGGAFGDKGATVERFKENYKALPENIKKRLVLENDDVSWSVHDLLPICEELNIPMVLDFHHHNIVFDSTQLREGTKDVQELYPRILKTWMRKNMTPKMHLSEPCPEAVTGRQRRKHNGRPRTLPPVPTYMDPLLGEGRHCDLMIEAKDKEQAVFELMRTYKLPGFAGFNDIIPYEREDDNREREKRKAKKKTKKQIKEEIEEFGRELSATPEAERHVVREEEVAMGGPANRVYWPPGMEEWLLPKKREAKKKGVDDDDLTVPTPYNFAARRELKERESKPLDDDFKLKVAEAGTLKVLSEIIDEVKAKNKEDALALLETPTTTDRGKKADDGTPKKARPKRKKVKTPSPQQSELSDMDEGSASEDASTDLNDEEGGVNEVVKEEKIKQAIRARSTPRRPANARKVNYKEEVDLEEEVDVEVR